MKTLERVLWAGGGFAAGFGFCLVLGLAVFFGWRSTNRVPRSPAAPVSVQIESRVSASASPDEGRPFTTLPEVSDYYGTQGFIMLGQFPRSAWPARVVSVKEGTNEISFTLKKGTRHRYPGYTGYRLKVVSLEDDFGAETLVVLRSKEKIIP